MRSTYGTLTFWLTTERQMHLFAKFFHEIVANEWGFIFASKHFWTFYLFGAKFKMAAEFLSELKNHQKPVKSSTLNCYSFIHENILTLIFENVIELTCRMSKMTFTDLDDRYKVNKGQGSIFNKSPWINISTLFFCSFIVCVWWMTKCQQIYVNMTLPFLQGQRSRV